MLTLEVIGPIDKVGEWENRLSEMAKDLAKELKLDVEDF
jgi:hypothetical protein